MMGTAVLGSAGAFITKTLADLALYKLLAGVAAAIGAVIIPTVVAAFFKLRRRDLSGHCPCGYNLTGNTSGVCPECGVEVQT